MATLLQLAKHADYDSYGGSRMRQSMQKFGEYVK